MKSTGRPTTAFAHCELRTPQQFNDEGFIEFNREYVKTLEYWGIYKPESSTQKTAVNPVARTNVCPEFHKPAELAMYAFTYTVPDEASLPSFMLSGGGEARKGPQPYHERIVAYGETSSAGLTAKLEFVVNEMTDRLKGLGFTWSDATNAQVYSIQNIGGTVGNMLARPGLIPGGINWHFARPPVIGFEVEMDLRGAVRQVFIS